MKQVKHNGSIINESMPQWADYLADIEAQKQAALDARTPQEKRQEEYGTAAEQLEFIVENGLDAFIDRQNAIKLKYPKEG